jgi:hypothetical protein
MQTITWMDNRNLMGELWPKWMLEPELSRLLNERWGSLHQDKLRECIRQHRLERDTKPDIAAIHKAYCLIVPQAAEVVGRSEVLTTRKNAIALQGPTEREVADWQEWADRLVATVTSEEFAECRERLGLMSLQANTPSQRRLTAVAVEYCRKNPATPQTA